MAITLVTKIKRFIGLSDASGDSKPTGVPVGSYFRESDTYDVYITYDGTNWVTYKAFGGAEWPLV